MGKLTESLVGVVDMLAIVVIACIIVLFAMVIDLASGLYKAKLRGEIRSSWGLKRTLSKFITYEGGMLIAAGVDLLVHLSHISQLFGLKVLFGIPVVTCLVGVFLLVVEFISIREKADKKTKKDMMAAADLLNKMIENENFRQAFQTALSLKDKEVNNEMD